MIASLILGVSLVTAAAPADAKAAYEEAKAKVGRDASSHVRLALWCEAHGLEAERLRHLALAVLLDPKDARARALMGLVSFAGRWERPEAIGPKVQADPALAASLDEYNERRARTPHTADAQWKLAHWCEERGLKPEATTHLTTVVRLDPKRDAAWKHLGYKQVKGRWLTDEQVATLRAELEAQKQADARWRKRLETLGRQLDRKPTKMGAAQALAEVTDPRAVPAIWATFVAGKARKPELAVQLLGQIDSPVASKALVILALNPSMASVRRAAAETLKRRDPREFAALLIALIREPIKYKTSDVVGPGSTGTLRIEGQTSDVERRYATPEIPNIPIGPDDFITYDVFGLPVINELIGPIRQTSIHFDPNNTTMTVSTADGRSFDPQTGNPMSTIFTGLILRPTSPLDTWGGLEAVMSNQPQPRNFFDNAMLNAKSPVEAEFYQELTLASMGLLGPPSDRIRNFEVNSAEVASIPIGRTAREAHRSAVKAQEKLKGDVASIERTNAELARASAPALELLQGSTGQAFGPNRRAWSKWLADANGYAFISNEAQNKPTVYEEVTSSAQPIPITVSEQVIGFQAISCFGKGTEVYTLSGRRPIEELKAGDRVLAWNTRSGSLEVQPILAVYHNPPSATLKIDLEGESIVTTPWHRFWLAGKGWVVARDLKPGDMVRTVERSAKVVAVDPAAKQPVFNLEIAEAHNFLVGRSGALVHDNSVAEAVTAPFDGMPKDFTALAATTPKTPAAGR